MTIEEYESTFKNKSTLRYKYFQILKDLQWHCRNCDASGIPSRQLAGGGGVQGLQHGTKNRPGITIISENRLCPKCNANSRYDRWDGTFKSVNSAAGLPKALQKRYCSIINMKMLLNNAFARNMSWLLTIGSQWSGGEQLKMLILQI